MIVTKLVNQSIVQQVGAKNYPRSSDSLVSPILVSLLLFSAIISATTFKPLQYATELALLVILSALVARERLSREELTLLMVFFCSQVGSFFVNDLSVFMLNAKQVGLAVFSLIYFRRHHPRSILIPMAFFACAMLVLFQVFVGRFPVDVSQYLTTLAGQTEARPLGLFLNFSFSAFFMATYLVGYTYKKRVFFLDFYLLWITSVYTGFLAYTGQKAMIFLNKRFHLFKSGKSQWLLFAGKIISIAIFLNASLEFLQFFNLGYSSAIVIFHQLTNPQTFVNAIYLLPGDILEHSQKFSYIQAIGGHDAVNELALITLLIQGGILLTAMYLFLLTKTLPQYRMLILFCRS